MAIVVLATYLTIVGGAWLGIYAAPLRVVTMLSASATLGIWLVACVRSERWRPRSVLMPVVVASLASLAISTAFSRVPRVSLEYLGYAIVLAALYLLLVRLMAQAFFARRLLILATLLFWLISGAFLGLVVMHWVDWWRELGRFAIPPLRPNFEGLTYNNSSAVLTMSALLSVPAAALVDPGTRRGKVALGAIVLTVGLVAFLSGSRAGWLAIGLTIVVAAAAALLDRRRRSAIVAAGRVIVATRTARATTSFVLAAAVLAAVVFTPAIVRRVSEGGADARAQYAVTALRMFAESPVVGTGPGTWVIQRISATSVNEIDVYIPHAHNIEVQTLAELGVVGAVAGVVLVAFLARLVLGAIRDPDPLRRRMGWTSLLGLSYLGFHQLLDFYPNMPAVLFAAAIPVAFLDATSIPGTALPPRRMPRLGGLVTIGAVLVALAGLLLQEVPALRAERAVQLLNGGDWVAAQADARAAADTDPAIGSYALTAGLAAARAGDHGLASAYFERVAVGDDLPEAWLDLAAEQLAQGDSAGATASLEAAFRLGRQRPAVALGVADLALRMGVRDLAVNAVVSTLTAYPTLAADPWWASDVQRTAVLGDAVTRILATGSPDLRWQVALMVNEAQQARTIAGGLPGSTFDLLVIDSWQGQERAFDLLVAACDAAPLDSVALTWCARVAAHIGRPDTAERMRRLEGLAPGFTNGSGRIRIVTEPDPAAILEGQLATFWGTFTYRRFTPVDMLVPSLAHLILE
ncbi:MAG: O-antigen ligase family protein [Chloroflexi bacterium]|nr:O-antigen ligase family protein [Chloroflexota bacterium]